MAPNPKVVLFKLGAEPLQQALGEVFIPTPAFPAEGTGLGEYGVVYQGQYVRSGRPNVTLGISDVNRIRVHGGRWEIFKDLPSPGGGQSQTFGCYQLPGLPFPPPPWDCTATPVASIGQTGYLSNAISRVCTVNHDSLADTVTVRWQPTCGPFGNSPACTPDNSINGAGVEVVADLANEGSFYSYTGTGTGPLQIQKLVVNATCGGAWVNFKLPLTLPNAGERRLVVIRGVPGLLYTENGNLKLRTP